MESFCAGQLHNQECLHMHAKNSQNEFKKAAKHIKFSLRWVAIPLGQIGSLDPAERMGMTSESRIWLNTANFVSNKQVKTAVLYDVYMLNWQYF